MDLNDSIDDSRTVYQSFYLNVTEPRRSHHSPPFILVSTYDAFLIVVILGFVSAALVGVIVALSCYCRLRMATKDPKEEDSDAYGTLKGYEGGSQTKDLSYDRKLAQSVQMFHFQHQKQQMLEMEKAKELAKQLESGKASDDDVGDDRFVVYECPGLANTGEMEVSNPLYSESPMPREAAHIELSPVPNRAVKRDTP